MDPFEALHWLMYLITCTITWHYIGACSVYVPAAGSRTFPPDACPSTSQAVGETVDARRADAARMAALQSTDPDALVRERSWRDT